MKFYSPNKNRSPVFSFSRKKRRKEKKKGGEGKKTRHLHRFSLNYDKWFTHDDKTKRKRASKSIRNLWSAAEVGLERTRFAKPWYTSNSGAYRLPDVDRNEISLRLVPLTYSNKIRLPSTHTHIYIYIFMSRQATRIMGKEVVAALKSSFRPKSNRFSPPFDKKVVSSTGENIETNSRGLKAVFRPILWSSVEEGMQNFA